MPAHRAVNDADHSLGDRRRLSVGLTGLVAGEGRLVDCWRELRELDGHRSVVETGQRAAVENTEHRRSAWQRHVDTRRRLTSDRLDVGDRRRRSRPTRRGAVVWRRRLP